MNLTPLFSPSNNDDTTTQFTNDGDGNLLTLKALLAGGAYETTQWVYGVTTGTGRDVNSNDILSAVQHPDKSTGNPSSGEQDNYTVNALGQTKTFTDRNGSVHTISSDILTRLTADATTPRGIGLRGKPVSELAQE